MDYSKMKKTQLVKETEALQKQIRQLKGARTKARNAQDTIREELDRMQKYLNVAATVIVALNPKGRVTFVNEKACEVLGFKQKDVLGKKWFDKFVPRSAAKKAKSTFQKLMAGETAQAEHSESPVLTKSGEERVIAWHNATLTDDKGNISGTLSTGEDVTESKQAQAQLKKTHKQLEKQLEQRTAELNKAKEQFQEAVGGGEQAQEKLRKRNEKLEKLLEERTAELNKAKEQLQEAVGGGEQAQEELRKRNEKLEKLLEERTAELNKAKEQLQEAVGGGEQAQEELKKHTEQLENRLARRKHAQEATRRVNRALKTLTECDKMLLRATDGADLLHNLSRSIAKAGGYPLAWIGLARNDETKTLHPVVYAGFEKGFLQNLSITWADTEGGRHPAGAAVRTARPIIARDILTDPELQPWRAAALRHGCTCWIALPLREGKRVIGALNIYAIEPDAFDVEEAGPLMELAGNIEYAMVATRTRAEQRETQEAKPEPGEDSLKHPGSTPDVIFTFDAKLTILTISPSVEETLGYAPDALIGKTFYQLNILTQESLKHIFTSVERVLAGEKTATTDFRLIAKDGSAKCASLTSAPLLKEGQAPAVICVARDIRDPEKIPEPQYQLDPQKVFVQELKKHDPTKSEFVSVVTREIGTPIVLLNSAVKMFLDGVLGEITPEQKTLLEMMGNNMEKLMKFTTEIVSLSKQEAKENV
jgi:PAS domain S-box-containing protein